MWWLPDYGVRIEIVRMSCLMQSCEENVELNLGLCLVAAAAAAAVISVVSDCVRPHRRQPTRLPRPWDSPGKNTGVGCHFLLQRMKVKSLSRV